MNGESESNNKAAKKQDKINSECQQSLTVRDPLARKWSFDLAKLLSHKKKEKNKTEKNQDKEHLQPMMSMVRHQHEDKLML